jgi:hypothetical protein
MNLMADQSSFIALQNVHQGGMIGEGEGWGIANGEGIMSTERGEM